MTSALLRPVSPFTLIAGTSLLIACGSGQIGGEVSEDPNYPSLGGGAGENHGGCEDGDVTEISADTQTTLGFAPSDVVALVEGSHTATLAWGTASDGSQLTVIPGASEGLIEIDVTVDPSSIRLVDLVPAETEGSGAEERNGTEMAAVGGATSDCAAEIRFDAEVRVSTSNRALDDTFSITFSAASPYEARGSAEVRPGEQSGSFDVTLDDPNAELLPTTLSITFTPGGMSGTLGGTYQTTDAASSTASAAFITYGSFPIDGCPTGAYVGADSEFASEMVAMLDRATIFDLTWSGAEPTTLSLVHQVETICFESGYANEDASVVMRLETTAASADARIAGTWQLEARVTLGSDGAAETISIVRQAYLVDTFAATEFEGETGIRGVAIPDGTSGTFDIRILDELADAEPAAGSLAVYAVSQAECTEREPEVAPTEGEGSSGACAGQTQQELETAELRAR